MIKSLLAQENIVSGIQLSNESICHGAAIDNQRDLIDDYIAGTNNIISILSAEAELVMESVMLNAGLDNDTLSVEQLQTHIMVLSERANKLAGKDAELTTTLNTILSNEGELTLSVEEYKNKKRTFVTKAVDNLVSQVTEALNADTWKNFIPDVTALYTPDNSRIETLKSLRADIVSGKLTVIGDSTKDSAIIAALGSFGAYSKKYDVKSLMSFLSGYYKLVDGDLLTTAMESVHDSLIVSKGNEKQIPIHKASIKYLEEFKNIKTTDYINKSTRIVIPSSIFGSTLHIHYIEQDSDEGLDYSSIGISSGNKNYKDFEVSMSKSELIALIDLVIDSRSKFKKGKSVEILKKTAIEVIKSMRSGIMTSVYGGLFGIFAIRRIIRQYMLANTFIAGLQTISIINYRDHSKGLIFAINVTKALTK